MIINLISFLWHYYRIFISIPREGWLELEVMSPKGDCRVSVDGWVTRGGKVVKNWDFGVT